MKKFKTLLSLDLAWGYRFVFKRARQRYSLYKSKIMGRSFFEVDVDGIKIKLSFTTPYHHSRARSFAEGTAEPGLLIGWRHCKAKRIYDIGGYNGIFGLVAAKANPGAEVVIFEPDRINGDHIEKNIRINELTNCRLVRAAVTDHDGTVHFTQSGTTGARIDDELGEPTDCVSLASLPPADLIKLDAEGAEARVLSTLNYKPVILLEEHPTFLARFGDTHESLWKDIEKRGYKAWFMGYEDTQRHYLLF